MTRTKCDLGGFRVRVRVRVGCGGGCHQHHQQIGDDGEDNEAEAKYKGRCHDDYDYDYDGDGAGWMRIEQQLLGFVSAMYSYCTVHNRFVQDTRDMQHTGVLPDGWTDKYEIGRTRHESIWFVFNSSTNGSILLLLAVDFVFVIVAKHRILDSFFPVLLYYSRGIPICVLLWLLLNDGYDAESNHNHISRHRCCFFFEETLVHRSAWSGRA